MSCCGALEDQVTIYHCCPHIIEVTAVNINKIHKIMHVYFICADEIILSRYNPTFVNIFLVKWLPRKPATLVINTFFI